METDKLAEVIIPSPTVFSTAQAPDVSALVADKLNALIKRALTYAALAVATLSGGGVAGYVLHAVTTVEKDLKPALPQPPIPVPVVPAPIPVIVPVPPKPAPIKFRCPQCGAIVILASPGTGQVGDLPKESPDDPLPINQTARRSGDTGGNAGNPGGVLLPRQSAVAPAVRTTRSPIKSSPTAGP